MRAPAVARWQAHLHGLATPTRELSGFDAPFDAEILWARSEINGLGGNRWGK